MFQTDNARTATQQALAQLLDAGHAYRSNATGDDVKTFKAASTAANRGFRGEPEQGATAPSACAFPMTARLARPRRDPR